MRRWSRLQQGALPGRHVEPPVGIEPTTFSLRAASTGELNLLVSVNHGWEHRYPDRIFQCGGPPGGHVPTTWVAWSGLKTYKILADFGGMVHPQKMGSPLSWM
jgi:hypothetical protein